MDITYLKMPGGNVYLMAIIDWYSRKALSWRVFNTMDGKGRALDNIRMERLWRSLKYEDIYLKHYETMGELKSGVSAYFNFYNSARFHQSLDYSVPDEMYESFQYNGLEYKQAV